MPRGEGDILTVTQNGFGKRTAVTEYPTKSRATQGVISIKVSERNGQVVGAVQVETSDQIMMITDAGTLVRTRVSEVSVVGRNTQGVTLIRTAEDETSSACSAWPSRWKTKSWTAWNRGRKRWKKTPRRWTMATTRLSRWTTTTFKAR